MTETVSGGEFLIRAIGWDDTFIPEEFSKENKAIAKSVKEFIAGEIQSRGDEVEHVNNELSRELMLKAGEIGLLAADIPEEYDGMALDKVSSLIISDSLGQSAGSFTITELNHTWYQLPRAETIERRRRQAPPDFRFAAKLTRSLTHEIDFQRWPDLAAAYRDGVAPLVQAGQLAAVLVQLPLTFDRTPAHRRHLAALLDMLHGLPLAVEFRHRSWASDRVLHELECRRVTLVIVDGPDLPSLFPVMEAVTNPDLFYARFYGRNVRGWRSGKTSDQFDYNYSDAELCEWVADKIEPLGRCARSGILCFNNHVRSQAPKNAARMIRLLKERGLMVA